MPEKRHRWVKGRSEPAKAVGHKSGLPWATAEARKSTMAGGAPTMAALALAKLCWEARREPA
jgi:hypothetical protein